MTQAMKMVNRVLLYLLTLICLSGVLFSAAYLVVNVMAIPKKMKEVTYVPYNGVREIETEEGLAHSAQGGQAGARSNLTEKPYDNQEAVSKSAIMRAYSFFDSISYDLSAVTPFILFWFFLSICWNVFRTERGVLKETDLLSGYDHLPMPRSYGATWIQLGFIGTLWGFLLIGWKMKVVAETTSFGTLDILLKAFGTALLSTFTAVMFVYIFAPLVQAAWRQIYSVEPPPIGMTPIEAMLGKLCKELDHTTSKVEGLGIGIELLKEQVGTLDPSLMIKVLDCIPVKMTDMTNRIISVGSETQDKIEAGSKAIVENLKPVMESEIRSVVEALNILSGAIEQQTKVMKSVLGETTKEVREGLPQMEGKLKGYLREQLDALVSTLKGIIEKMGENFKKDVEVKLDRDFVKSVNEKLDDLSRMANRSLSIQSARPSPDKEHLGTKTHTGSILRYLRKFRSSKER